MSNIRPLLKEIAPSTAYNVKGFAFCNILIGCVLLLAGPKVQTFQNVGIITLKEWGIVFLAHGLLSAWVFRKNDWKNIKRALLAGCVLQAIWTLLVFSTSLTNSRPLLFTFLAYGAFLLYLEVGTYINFTPRYHAK